MPRPPVTHPGRLLCGAFVAASLALVPGSLAAQSDTSRWVLIAPNPHYDAGGIHRMLFGADYRDLWTVPTKVQVLDLGTYAGGLTPVKVGGGQQTKSLRLSSADGREFNFRSVDKDPSAILPEDLKGTIADDILQDQISSALPAGPLIVDPLLTAAGVIHASPEMFVMPDDPRLGEFRTVFAGMLGMLEENPKEGLPLQIHGLEHASKIIEMDKLLDRLEADGREHIDTLAFLRARLMDVFVGDWDRHRGQWKWARLGPDDPSTPWVPVPEDRDQAFIRYDGMLLSIARYSYPQLVSFQHKYSRTRGATYNGRELDRRLLESLDRPLWDSVASDLQRQISDQVIDSAVRRLPIQEFRLEGDRIAEWLRLRRDDFREMAEKYYRYLAEQAELHGTDGADRVTITREGTRGEVTVLMEAPGDSVLVRQAQRTFRPSDTREVRIFLHGGDDSVLVDGAGTGKIRIRIIGGEGRDVVQDNSRAGNVKVYDTGDHTTIASHNGIGLNRKRYTQPDTSTKVPPIDWGGYTNPLVWASGGPDVGAFIGAGLVFRRFGFRKDPYASQQILRAGYATGARTYRAEYRGVWHQENSRAQTNLLVRASGIEMLRFHGFGNESSNAGGDAFYKAESNQYLVEPSLTEHLGRHVAITLGPRVQFSNQESNSGRFIATLPNLYGAGEFGEVGARGSITIDARDVPAAPRRGVLINVEGTVYPGIWDVETTFGKIAGQASTYLSASVLTLALRAGGEKVLGRFPWFESAFLGGHNTVRGWHEQRFAGDASAYGNAELRVHLARMMIVVPTDVGVFGLADAGRVFLEGEDSNELHTGFGGGISLGFLSRANTVSLAVAKSDEKTGFYFRAGFLF
ncbi:MAG TPA: BamA/TamA family outer membrane protein [Gemmatimonadales bacterium]|nr:BamA/TamA family outer membrane protein [Gemmatimonadales bacterium]